ncbi:MAG: Rrf2 family transcriptional regulator [Termitinemataceae bacterium]
MAISADSSILRGGLTRFDRFLRIMLYLGLWYKVRPVQAGELAAATGSTEKYLGQLMLTLRGTGLVRSLRGVSGGYVLARNPESIPLIEIYTIVDQGILQNHARSKMTRQDTGASMNLELGRRLFGEWLQKGIQDALASKTLADLIAAMQHRSEGADWII